jgi:hypothetical protein
LPNMFDPLWVTKLWYSIYNPVILEALIIEQNQKQFTQAKGSVEQDQLQTVYWMEQCKLPNCPTRNRQSEMTWQSTENQSISCIRRGQREI